MTAMDSDTDEDIAIAVTAYLQEKREKKKNDVAGPGSGCSVGICVEHTTK